ncbi:MAG: TIGR03089 family protein [Propionicimonas sp.]
MPVARSIIDVLTDRVRTDGSRPLLTYYNPAKGERVEFSGRSFANWVDKTANLIDTLGVEGRIAGPVSMRHPGHWMSLIWPLAAWQRGLAYEAAEPPLPPEAELAVVGPENPQPLIPGGTIACSLHPLGLGVRDLPAGVLDYSSEALAEPDAHWATPIEPEDIAFLDDLRQISHADWLGLPPEPDRVLFQAGGPRAWLTLQETLIRPLLGGGSAVVVDSRVSKNELARIIASERIDHEAGEPDGPNGRSYPGVGTGRTS